MRMTEGMYAAAIDELSNENEVLRERVSLLEGEIAEMERRDEESTWCLNAFMDFVFDHGSERDELAERGIWQSLEKLKLA